MKQLEPARPPHAMRVALLHLNVAACYRTTHLSVLAYSGRFIVGVSFRLNFTPVGRGIVQNRTAS